MELRCPVDGHDLERRDIDRRPAAACRHCHGIWISGPAIAETQLRPDQVPSESRRVTSGQSDATPRHCPLCDTRMRSEQHAGVTIERCAACDSVWLDAGEFDAVRTALLPHPTSPHGNESNLGADWSAWQTLGDLMYLLPAFLDG
jgi:Zn-finger nucleic acid-binding protein